MTTETTLQLSEHLYPTDEVIGSLVQSMLTQKSLHECLFWLWELLASTPNVPEGLTVIYRQFYASSSSNLGRYISRKVDNYIQTQDKRNLADIIANLRTSKYTGTAYLITRYSEKSAASVIYRPQQWMKLYPDKSTQILGSLHARDIHNVGWHCEIHSANYGIDSTMNVIKLYAQNHNIDIDDGIDAKYDTSDGIQIASALARIFDHPPWNVRSRFVRAPADMVSEIDTHFTQKSKQYWRKLSEKRLYPTHGVMPPGNYGRYTVECFKKACHYSWEYYCYESVLWNKRFETYCGTKNDEKKSIDFKDDDYLENFYDDDNCMDFDEQPLEVQNMSLHEINIIQDPLEWLNLIKSQILSNALDNMSL